MTRLFASYLTEEVAPAPIEGTYDPEQELWIAGDTTLASADRPNWSCNVTVLATILFDIGLDCNKD